MDNGVFAWGRHFLHLCLSPFSAPVVVVVVSDKGGVGEFESVVVFFVWM